MYCFLLFLGFPNGFEVLLKIVCVFASLLFLCVSLCLVVYDFFSFDLAAFVWL